MRTQLLFMLFWTAFGLCQTSPSREKQARAQLDEALKDSNPEIRKQCVMALSLVGSREPYILQLTSMLDDKDVDVRVATITSLVDLHNQGTVAALKKALADDVPEVSFAAAKALWALNDPTGAEALISVLSGVTKAASGFFTKQRRETLRMTHMPKTMFMFALRQGAAFAPVPGLGAGVASLQGLLADPGVSGRASAGLLLANDKDPSVLEALRDALEDKDWSVRAAAVHALALRNDPALQPSFTPLLDDKREAVRLRAAAGYLRLEMIKAMRSPAKRRHSVGKKGV